MAAAAGYGYRYWTIGRYLQLTDDATIKADYTTIAPKVSGTIAEVLVRDNQRVDAGQLLARIDDRDFRTALDEARADITGADSAIRNFDVQLALQQSLIDQERATIAATKASLKFGREDFVRYQAVMKTGFGTVQRAQQAGAALGEKAAQLQRDRAGLIAARKKIDVLARNATKPRRGAITARRWRTRPSSTCPTPPSTHR
jgi:membrane fusion protein, multidrug efflux system